MSDGVVVVQRFDNEPSAWLARAVLESAGIPSEVLTDEPFAHPQPQVRLVVRAEDAEAAREALHGPSRPLSA